MNFIAIIMTPSIVFREKFRESVRKNYCPISIQMYLTFVYVPYFRKRVNLKTGVSRKQSTPSFPKN